VDLTEHQQWIIKEWAMQTPYVREVRLYGSRAKGAARPDNDIALAITVGGDDPGTILGHYLADGERWHQLTRLLEANVHVGLYNDPAGSNRSRVLRRAQRLALQQVLARR
jgi:hypothetical protein